MAPEFLDFYGNPLPAAWQSEAVWDAVFSAGQCQASRDIALLNSNALRCSRLHGGVEHIRVTMSSSSSAPCDDLISLRDELTKLGHACVDHTDRLPPSILVAVSSRDETAAPPGAQAATPDDRDAKLRARAKTLAYFAAMTDLELTP